MAFAEEVVRRWEERGFEKTAMATVGAASALRMCRPSSAGRTGAGGCCEEGSVGVAEDWYNMRKMRCVIAQRFVKFPYGLRAGL